MNILTVVRAAPRTPETLPATLESIEKAGAGDIVVVCEPGVNVPKGYAVRRNKERLGSFRNYDNAGEIALEYDYDYFLIIEDDIVMRGDAYTRARELISEADPGTFGVASLYFSIRNAKQSWKLSQGWQETGIGWDWWGAQAFLFSRKSLLAMRTESYYLWHLNNYKRNQQNDACTMHSLGNLGLKKYFHNPSLVDHVGDRSTIGHAPRSENRGHNFTQLW